MDPVTKTAAWLRHERATRAAQMIIPLLLRSGDHERAGMWMAWMIGLFETKALDRA